MGPFFLHSEKELEGIFLPFGYKSTIMKYGNASITVTYKKIQE
jgi:hypothetical protein